MGRTDDLTKLERTVKETDARLKTLLSNLQALDFEIKKIVVLERTLVENVKILKTKQVIAIAQEFKKAKEELRSVKVRLVALRNDREHFSKAFKDTKEFLKTLEAQHRKIVREGENNVIKFRRTDGKE